MAAVDPAELIALDANFLVAALNRNSPSARQFEDWLSEGMTVQISAVAWSEYLCGPLQESDAQRARRTISSVDPFTEEDAHLASDLFNRTGRRSRSHVDCMIAAHAIVRKALLATRNLQDFRRFEKYHLRLVPKS